ncbi:MAG: hypothetical protein FWF51_09685, partial [Chitinivibrionia bacterium]|nr:hypothetical protein [Chitinivibrionia bacterium]
GGGGSIVEDIVLYIEEHEEFPYYEKSRSNSFYNNFYNNDDSKDKDILDFNVVNYQILFLTSREIIRSKKIEKKESFLSRIDSKFKSFLQFLLETESNDSTNNSEKWLRENCDINEIEQYPFFVKIAVLFAKNTTDAQSKAIKLLCENLDFMSKYGGKILQKYCKNISDEDTEYAIKKAGTKFLIIAEETRNENINSFIKQKIDFPLFPSENDDLEYINFLLNVEVKKIGSKYYEIIDASGVKKMIWKYIAGMKKDIYKRSSVLKGKDDVVDKILDISIVIPETISMNSELNFIEIETKKSLLLEIGTKKALTFVWEIISEYCKKIECDTTEYNKRSDIIGDWYCEIFDIWGEHFDKKLLRKAIEEQNEICIKTVIERAPNYSEKTAKERGNGQTNSSSWIYFEKKDEKEDMKNFGIREELARFLLSNIDKIENQNLADKLRYKEKRWHPYNGSKLNLSIEPEDEKSLISKIGNSFHSEKENDDFHEYREHLNKNRKRNIRKLLKNKLISKEEYQKLETLFQDEGYNYYYGLPDEEIKKCFEKDKDVEQWDLIHSQLESEIMPRVFKKSIEWVVNYRGSILQKEDKYIWMRIFTNSYADRPKIWAKYLIEVLEECPPDNHSTILRIVFALGHLRELLGGKVPLTLEKIAREQSDEKINKDIVVYKDFLTREEKQDDNNIEQKITEQRKQFHREKINEQRNKSSLERVEKCRNELIKGQNREMRRQ